MVIGGFLILAVSASAPGITLTPPQSQRKPTTTSIQLQPEQLLAFAEPAQARGDNATAETAYKALSHDPNSDIRNEARFRYSKMLAARGENTDAAILLRQILDEKPQ